MPRKRERGTVWSRARVNEGARTRLDGDEREVGREGCSSVRVTLPAASSDIAELEARASYILRRRERDSLD